MKKRILTITGILITSVMASQVFAAGSLKTDSESISWTKNFLTKLEKQNINDVEREINKVNKDTQLGKFDIKSARSRFDDVVFLGDSITEYLREANILDAASVLAMKGEHVLQARKHINEVKSLKPKSIVILYGANDITAYSPDVFRKNYIKLIKDIKAVDKGVRIYIQAPLPVLDRISKAKDYRISNENISEFTKAAKAAANETGATFLSSDGLVNDEEQFEQDGIHFKYGFYLNWLQFLSENI